MRRAILLLLLLPASLAAQSAARNASGELFGFERTAAIVGKSADQIAKTAELFGQEDDITVLTLTLAPAGVVHA